MDLAPTAVRTRDQRSCRWLATADRQVMCSSLLNILEAIRFNCLRSEHLRVSKGGLTAVRSSVSAGRRGPSGAKLGVLRERGPVERLRAGLHLTLATATGQL
jgi:hypothetical protein